MKFPVTALVCLVVTATTEAFVVQPPQPTITALSAVVEVTPKTIKQLRDDTGAGMMDCKRALLDAEGDMEAATEALRKKGLGKADKKAARVAAEGRMVSAISDNMAALAEVNCETDFVAKDSSFIGFCGKVGDAVLDLPVIGGVQDDVSPVMGASAGDSGTLEEERQALVAKIGENIQVRRLASRGSDDSVVGAYVHLNRIGVLVELNGGTPELAADVAMHVAAMNPPFATPDDVPQDVLEKERKILSEQALESGKPEKIVEKMVEGRIRKYLEEICCVSQTYVKTNDKTVGKLLEENGASMIGFTRIAVGEGIEKKSDDFAAEVASMAAGK